MHAFLTDNDSWTEQIKKTTPKFRVTYHDLIFNDQTTLYLPGRANPENSSRNSMGLMDENIVYSQLDKEKCTSQKTVFEEVYLISDSTRHIRWKITDETRVIAGFSCRRANALLFDSVYIVAYYTDAILTTGGPESLCGLPGMILGLAVPHEHVTWFATRVYTEEIKQETLKPPVKGKPKNHATLKETLVPLLERWGSDGNRVIMTAML